MIWRICRMKYFLFFLFIFLAIIIHYGCGTSATQLKMQEPEEGKCIVVGAILVENNGVDDFYRSIKSKITVIVVGKNVIDGEEFIEGYRLKTDDDGYFYLSNVPRGSYVIKGIELNLGYGGLTFITSRWDGNRQIFQPTANMIDYVVRSWPEEVLECVNDIGINYFMIDPTMGIYFDRFPELRNSVLALKKTAHTMSSPEKYYQEQYPNIQCLSE